MNRKYSWMFEQTYSQDGVRIDWRQNDEYSRTFVCRTIDDTSLSGLCSDREMYSTVKNICKKRKRLESPA